MVSMHYPQDSVNVLLCIVTTSESIKIGGTISKEKPVDKADVLPNESEKRKSSITESLRR